MQSTACTFGFCRHIVDMIGISVNLIGGHIHLCCMSIIPKSAACKLTYAKHLEMLRASMLLLDVKPCKVMGANFA